jgi:hypothetical protein
MAVYRLLNLRALIPLALTGQSRLNARLGGASEIG